MKKGLLGFCIAMCLFVACGKRQGESQPTLSTPVLVTSDKVYLDTLEEGDLEELFFSPVEENFFSGRDGIFEEFLYEFCADSAMQMHRIHFPLPYLHSGEETMLSEEDWTTLGLLNLTDIYHTLFEHDAEMDIERDTSVRKANLECVDMKSKVVRVFSFEKQGEWWMLHRINELMFNEYRHRDFYSFYYRFITDSLYQSVHVNDPMTFVTVDPEDDFNILEANIDMEQWFAFNPLLPEHLLMNVEYGVKPSRRPTRKILTCKSLGGNFNTTSYFRRIGGEWVLTRFEDMSN